MSEKDFIYHGDLEEDLTSFSRIYMTNVTPQMVKVSIGLRTEELQGAALPGILKVPMFFKKVLVKYFTEMIEDGKMRDCDAQSVALQFISMNFEFVFLDASFGKKLVGVSKEKYIKDSVKTFVCGISVK